MEKKHNIDFNTFLKKFKEQMSKSGFKNSLQKDYLLKILFFSKEHLTVEEIVLKSKIDYNIDISTATVYKIIKFFENLNIVKSLNIGDNVRKYELNLFFHHDHLVCTSCGKIVEFTDDLIEEKQLKVAQKREFKLKDHVMTIYGLCAKCQ